MNSLAGREAPEVRRETSAQVQTQRASPNTVRSLAAINGNPSLRVFPSIRQIRAVALLLINLGKDAEP